MKNISKTLFHIFVLIGVLFGVQSFFPAASLAAPAVGTPVVSPAEIPVGQSTAILVTSRITSDPPNPVIATGVNLLRVDASNKVMATLGTMRDNGTQGDAVAGDGTFTLTVSLNEAAAGEVRLLVSAAFKGLLKRVLSNVTAVPARFTPPTVQILSPHDGVAMNRDFLRVQALAGSTDKRLVHVEVTLDGLTLDQADAVGCPSQMLADFRLPLTGLTAGTHQVTVTAVQDNLGSPALQNASATFVLDPTLPMGEPNRIEEEATPEPLACITPSGTIGINPLSLSGKLVLGKQGDGINLTLDRVILAVGGMQTVLEPGTMICGLNSSGRPTCHFTDAVQPFIQMLELEDMGGGAWRFAVSGTSVPSGEIFYLRIGDDWGGIALNTGALQTALNVTLDPSHQGHGVIGPAGGTVQTTDADGVVIRLSIPTGALPNATLISITPLLNNPVPGGAVPLHPGIRFEPEGLQFAKPAILSMDFSGTVAVVTPTDRIFLLTSPVTLLPLLGSADPAAKKVMALLQHFSTTQPGAPGPTLSDLAAWADPILSAQGQTTLTELQSLLALAAQQQLNACQTNCLDIGAVIQQADAAITALVGTVCPADVSNPSMEAAQMWFLLWGNSQLLGVTQDQLLYDCVYQVMESLVNQTGDETIANPSDENLSRLFDLSGNVQLMGFDALAQRALDKFYAAVQGLITQSAQLCNTDQPTGHAELARALGWTLTLPYNTLLSPLASVAQAEIDQCGVGVIITPSAAIVMQGGQVQFTANVIGTTQTGLNWSASAGSIAADGLYTAPSAEGTYTVTVRLAAFPTKYSEATVTVQNPGALVVNVVGTKNGYDWTYATSRIYFGFDCEGDENLYSDCSIFPTPTFSDTPIPYTISGCQFTASINRDSPSVLGVDVSVSLPADGSGSCPEGTNGGNYSLGGSGAVFVTLDITATRTGFLTLQADPQWVGDNPYIMVYHLTSYPVDPYYQALLLSSNSYYGSSFNTSVPISPSTPIALAVMTAASGGSAGVNLNAARVLTISFSESP